MKKEDFSAEISAFLQRFVVIYGFTMLATLVFLLLFNRSVTVGWPYFLWCVFFSLAADLPTLLFLSDHELSEAEWRRRMFVSAALTEVILMPLGRLGGMWRGWLGAVLFFLTILAVTFGVRAVSYGVDACTAHLLNEQIRRRRLSQQKGTPEDREK